MGFVPGRSWRMNEAFARSGHNSKRTGCVRPTTPEIPLLHQAGPSAPGRCGAVWLVVQLFAHIFKKRFRMSQNPVYTVRQFRLLISGSRKATPPMLTAAFKAVERAKANGWSILVGDA